MVILRERIIKLIFYYNITIRKGNLGVKSSKESVPYKTQINCNIHISNT